MTKLTWVMSLMSASGSPGTATRSANLPASTVPRSFSTPSSFAPPSVADWMAYIAGMPASTM